MQKRRKFNKCLNCGVELDNIYNYCPKCGQENTNNNVSFQILFRDFLNNYFSLDSRFSKSIKPFLTKPGLLTNQFLDGKRVSFAHPVRLYFILSLFYFFILSLAAKQVLNEGENAIDEASASFEESGAKDLLKSDSTLITAFDQPIDLDSLISAAEKGDVDYEDFGKIDYYTKDSTTFDNDDSDSSFLNQDNWDVYGRLYPNLDITNEQIFDSLDFTETLTPYQENFAKQIMKVHRSDNDAVLGHVLKNLPIMMFFLLPAFALILKLLYVRKKKLYIVHLVHAIHLHCFAYLVYGITILLILYAFPNIESAENIIGLLSFIGVSTYAYKSFRVVYQQGRWKTILKFNLMGGFYFTLLFTAVLVELFLSLISY